jgi:hypothetical protein
MMNIYMLLSKGLFSFGLRHRRFQPPNEIVIKAMIKGLHPWLATQYFARKPLQSLEKLQKMDEYIRADNDFRQRREEA